MNRIAKFFKVSPEQFGRDCYENIILPRRATAGSAGYDFIAPYDFELGVGEEIVIDTGVRARIADGWVLVIFPRSGSGFKFGVRLANTAGINNVPKTNHARPPLIAYTYFSTLRISFFVFLEFFSKTTIQLLSDVLY